MSLREVLGGFFGRRFVASISGGLFYDWHHPLLVNTIQLYTWLFLLVFPISISAAWGSDLAPTLVYSGVILLLFSVIKVMNYWLHQEFDKEKQLKDDDEDSQEKKDSPVNHSISYPLFTPLKSETPVDLPKDSKEEESDKEQKLERSERADRKEEKRGRILVNESEEEDDGSAVLPMLSSATRKSKTSTAAFGERDSEVSSSLDSSVMKEIALQWPAEEDGGTQSTTEGPSMKENEEMSEGEISEGEIKVSNDTPSEKKKEESKEEEEEHTGNLLDDPRNYGLGEGESNVFTYIDEFGEVQTYVMFDNTTRNTRTPNRNTGTSSVARASDIPTLSTSRSTFTVRDTDNTSEEDAPEKKTTEEEASDEGIIKPLTIRFKLLCCYFRIPFDRLFLQALLDRNDNWIEILLCIFLATSTAALGIQLVRFYREFAFFMLCFVIATSQYSLLKSPQPDACSPRHDHNKLNAYNRSFYFSILAACTLALNAHTPSASPSLVTIYGFNINLDEAIFAARDFLIDLIPYLPLIHLLGLFPQCNTVIMYFIEQINIHALGGTGSANIAATITDFIRSIVIIGILYGIGYASELTNQYLMALFVGLLVGLSFIHSRMTTDPSLYKHLFNFCHRREILIIEKEEINVSAYPKKRLLTDLVLGLVITIVSMLLYMTTLFNNLHPYGFYTLCVIECVIGVIAHYIICVLRQPVPFKIFRRPFFESQEYALFDPPNKPSHPMWFEKLFRLICSLEKAIFFPVIFMTAIAVSAPVLLSKWGLHVAVLILCIAGIKLFRGTFSDSSQLYWILFFTLLIFHFDYRRYSETFVVDFVVATFLVTKIQEFIMKVDFILIYIAPWGLSWGSVAHAALQPLGIPHTVLCGLQLVWSTLISAPIYPFIGSALFLSSYARPVKFWERSYKTNRVDNSQMKLSETLDGAGTEQNMDNLNSIFYEHLMISLQDSLCRDIEAGRLGNVSTGDFFMIVNDKLTAMIHIIELGNGYCTFQLRGMEFKGTYCQERELEEINSIEYTKDSDGISCGSRSIPKPLPLLHALMYRWFSWEAVNTNLMLRTYSISLNPANSMLNMWSLRMVLIKYYVLGCIYYLLKSPSLESWLHDPIIAAQINSIGMEYVDMDPIFSKKIDEDFDDVNDGISLKSFDRVYGKWVEHCLQEKMKNLSGKSDLSGEDGKLGTPLSKFCYLLSLLARRCLVMSPHNSSNTVLFLQRFHALFKGDFRISSTKDEFVLADVDIMNKVLGKAIRMSLRLHQDHFIGGEFDDFETLYKTFEGYENELVCCHEGDPLWRKSILSNVPTMISLRKSSDNSSMNGEFGVLQLTLRYMKFRVIKLNRESVRGLWAGQVQEIVFLGNTNTERGSIQQLRTVLRNLVNQSCDFPVGYPIFVSPLTTSYSSFWPEMVKDYKWITAPKAFFTRLWKRSSQGSNRNSSQKLQIVKSKR